MATVPVEYGLLLAAVLFTLGLVGVLVRRNIVFILLSIEIMLNAAGLAFVVAGSRWGQPDGTCTRTPARPGRRLSATFG